MAYATAFKFRFPIGRSERMVRRMRAPTPTEVAYELLPFGVSEQAVVRMILLECSVSEYEATEAVRAAREIDERVAVFS